MITKQELKDKNTKLTLANKELRASIELIKIQLDEKEKERIQQLDYTIDEMSKRKQAEEQSKDKDTTISLQAQEITLLKNQLALAKEDRTRAMDEVKSFKQALAIVAAAGK